ncbi:MAG: alpha/beta hydrolase domain-containing protein [Vicinamibacterales bacterium]|jgi:hypothetical protein|nr:alpha/beta hydrolase domain-containing protein [Vicinamibacterales bacterium]MDP6608851.1 alpha/beta hydrolase domain-containing protein [Vicinamibacterales bacterium]HAK55858.1 hypothetical protein [Acidobacteriota bacterium]
MTLPRFLIVNTWLAVAACLAVTGPAEARLVRLEVERREVVLDGRPFGLAGPFERLVGTAHFALDPDRPQNEIVVDLALAPRNARGEVEFSADFYLLKPLDPNRGNGRLFYEAGNRGSKRILRTFQQASNSADPTTAEEFGDGALMHRGFSLLWLGWQWDVPDGRMRMSMPTATNAGEPIAGLVRGNFVGPVGATARLADRGHRAYPVVDPSSDEHVMLVKTLPTDPPEVVPRDRWRFTDLGTVTVELEGGFEPGRIYDVVYLSEGPRVVGTGLAGTRDIVSFFKYSESPDNPLPGIDHALAWGVSQTGRFLRHFVYQGFNQDESGRQVFDGIIAQVGGGGRGSFNHRFAQASRDALQHYNFLFPVDMFPFTDATLTDPVTGARDGLLRRAEASGTVPKFFHVLTNSEYFNRAGSLVHTDPTGARDIAPPATSRIYMLSSAPHIIGRFPPAPNPNATFLGQASMNTLVYAPVIRALFDAMDAWVADEHEPPASRYPRLADGTLTAPPNAGWPAGPTNALPRAPLTALRLDYGPDWASGIVSREPPGIGEPFVQRVPAVDEAGNDRAGIRMPEIEVPLATQTGWNYRDPGIGAPDRLSSEIGSYFPLARTRAERERIGDDRRSIDERYRDKHDYLGRITAAALALVAERYLLASDLPEVIERAAAHYDWATR